MQNAKPTNLPSHPFSQQPFRRSERWFNGFFSPTGWVSATEYVPPKFRRVPPVLRHRYLDVPLEVSR